MLIEIPVLTPGLSNQATVNAVALKIGNLHQTTRTAGITTILDRKLRSAASHAASRR